MSGLPTGGSDSTATGGDTGSGSQQASQTTASPAQSASPSQQMQHGQSPSGGQSDQTPQWLRGHSPNALPTPEQWRKFLEDGTAMHGRLTKAERDGSAQVERYRASDKAWNTMQTVPGMDDILGALSGRTGADAQRGLAALAKELGRQAPGVSQPTQQRGQRGAAQQPNGKGSIFDLPEEEWDGALEARAGEIAEQKVNAIMERYFGPLAGQVFDMQTNSQMEQLVRDGYTDLPKYREAVLEKMTQLPGVNMKQALLLVLDEAGVPLNRKQPPEDANGAFQEMGGERRGGGNARDIAEKKKQAIMNAGNFRGLPLGS